MRRGRSRYDRTGKATDAPPPSRSSRAALLLVTGWVMPRPPPPRSPRRRGQAEPAGGGRGWLARQMTDRSHFVTDSPRRHLSQPGRHHRRDLRVRRDRHRQTATARGPSPGWSGRASCPATSATGTTESYAGATAKVLLAVEVRGDEPGRSSAASTWWPGCGKLLTPSGRYRDHSKYGDFSNAFSQALAIIAFSRHGGAPAKAVSFLVRSECKNGGFPLDFAPEDLRQRPGRHRHGRAGAAGRRTPRPRPGAGCAGWPASSGPAAASSPRPAPRPTPTAPAWPARRSPLAAGRAARPAPAASCSACRSAAAV